MKKITKVIKKLELIKDEWESIVEEQGENWDQYDAQIGEINGLQFAIDVLKGKFDEH